MEKQKMLRNVMGVRVRLLRIAPTLSLVALLFTTVPLAGNSTWAQPDYRLPPGDWTLAAGPYWGPGYQTIPVDVYSVLTDASKGLAVKQVGLQNRTDRTVSSLRFLWEITQDKVPSQVLLQGSTPIITLEKAIPPKKDYDLHFPIVTFATIVHQLTRTGSLQGHYRILVLISEVHFGDGTSWKKGEEPGRASKVAFRPVSAVQIGACTNCALQKCQWSLTKNSYVCVDSVDCEECKLQDKDNCLNSRCVSTKPGQILP